MASLVASILLPEILSGAMGNRNQPSPPPYNPLTDPMTLVLIAGGVVVLVVVMKDKKS